MMSIIIVSLNSENVRYTISRPMRPKQSIEQKRNYILLFWQMSSTTHKDSIVIRNA